MRKAPCGLDVNRGKETLFAFSVFGVFLFGLFFIKKKKEKQIEKTLLVESTSIYRADVKQGKVLLFAFCQAKGKFSFSVFFICVSVDLSLFGLFLSFFVFLVFFIK